MLVQKCHYKTGNVAKLKAAIDVYTGIARFNQTRQEVLAKLTGMLLHPFPSVGTATSFGRVIVSNEQ